MSAKTIELTNPQSDVLESTAQRILMHCGVGSGKSHAIGFVALDFARNNPEVRGFIGANTFSQLTKSTLDRVFKVWEDEFMLKRDVHYVIDIIPPPNWKVYGPRLKSYENTITFNNGALIFTASLDNYKVIDGTEFGWACLDETKDTKEEAVKEVIVARLRQRGMLIDSKGVVWSDVVVKRKVEEGLFKAVETDSGLRYYDETNKVLNGYNPLYIFTSPAKVRWISEWFKLDDYFEEITKSIFSKNTYYRKRLGDQLVVIASTYHNEQNLPSGYIDRLINDIGGTKGLVDMLIYGSPFGKTGGEFYSSFDRVKHVKDVEPTKGIPIHISFDFNVVPYITMTLWQITRDTETNRYLVNCFDELCLPSPHNNIESLCLMADSAYGHLFKAGLYYYGDYSGKNGQTMTSEFKHHYEVVDKVFKKYLHNDSDRVIVNPLLMKRRNFVNKLLNGGFPIDLIWSYKCKESLGDMEFTKEGPDGGKLKKRVMNKETGKSYEEHGHTSDSGDYFLCSAFSNYFNV